MNCDLDEEEVLNNVHYSVVYYSPGSVHLGNKGQKHKGIRKLRTGSLYSPLIFIAWI